ncbi:unnamed protein product [Brachionus calyciflorus]|uniref:Amine oxidase domain-containing protein n=1 Tax=Brachionus calyciflorus TaxID=104777 RepID=A0A813UW17_9BILA|nr:unnamed protein product [Brachionus calyciflorus]
MWSESKDRLPSKLKIRDKTPKTGMTKWHSNRYSRGSYSHMPLGSSPDDFEAMARPIPSEQNFKKSKT